MAQSRSEPGQQFRTPRESAARQDHRTGAILKGDAGFFPPRSYHLTVLDDKPRRPNLAAELDAELGRPTEQRLEHARWIGGVRARNGLPGGSMDGAKLAAELFEPAVGGELVVAVRVHQRGVTQMLAGCQNILAQLVSRVANPGRQLLVGASIRVQP